MCTLNNLRTYFLDTHPIRSKSVQPRRGNQPSTFLSIRPSLLGLEFHPLVAFGFLLFYSFVLF